MGVLLLVTGRGSHYPHEAFLPLSPQSYNLTSIFLSGCAVILSISPYKADRKDSFSLMLTSIMPKFTQFYRFRILPLLQF
jgi:hypothetical protein